MRLRWFAVRVHQVAREVGDERIGARAAVWRASRDQKAYGSRGGIRLFGLRPFQHQTRFAETRLAQNRNYAQTVRLFREFARHAAQEREFQFAPEQRTQTRNPPMDRCLFFDTRQLPDGLRFAFALEGHYAARDKFKLVADEAHGFLADKNFAALGNIFQPRSEIDGIA